LAFESERGFWDGVKIIPQKEKGEKRLKKDKERK
jgi:hypothetical protein